MITFQDGYAVGTLDGTVQFNISLPGKPAPQNGFVGLGTADYGLADFDNLKITESSEGEATIISKNKKSTDYNVLNKHHLDTVIKSVDKDISVDNRITANNVLEQEVENTGDDDTLYFQSLVADNDD